MPSVYGCRTDRHTRRDWPFRPICPTPRAAAGEICQQVTLFGFQKRWKGQKLKYHYYNDVEPNESQTARDVVEAARFSQWLHAMNKYAVACRPNCDDPRIDTRLTADRVRYAEALSSSPPGL